MEDLISHKFRQDGIQQVLNRFNHKAHFSIESGNICSVCRRDTLYYQDISSLMKHCRQMTALLHEYITVDPTKIITSYISETAFICHHCELAINLQKEFTTTPSTTDIDIVEVPNGYQIILKVGSKKMYPSFMERNDIVRMLWHEIGFREDTDTYGRKRIINLL